jgi:CRP/FNR family transcriptional regulator, cyclic AMP receptor protein
METQQLSEHFSLFHKVNFDILERFLSLTNQEEYSLGDVIIDEENWGRAMYFIVSGWVKIETRTVENNFTMEIIGRGGFFGQEGILSNQPANCRVVTLTAVKLLMIPAQRFLQFIYQYTSIQNRLLTITVAKVREYQKYCQFHRQAMKVRLAHILINLAEQYGEVTTQGMKIHNLPISDLADLAQLTPLDCEQILDKFTEKSLLIIDHHHMYIPNLKPLNHIIGQLGNS